MDPIAPLAQTSANQRRSCPPAARCNVSCQGHAGGIAGFRVPSLPWQCPCARPGAVVALGRLCQGGARARFGLYAAGSLARRPIRVLGAC